MYFFTFHLLTVDSTYIQHPLPLAGRGADVLVEECDKSQKQPQLNCNAKTGGLIALALSEYKYQNSMPFNKDLWSTEPTVDSFVAMLYGVLQDTFALYKKRHKSHTEHLKLILLNLLKAYRQDPERYVAYSRSRNIYHPAVPGAQGLSLSFDTMMTIIDALLLLGWVEGKIGDKYSKTSGADAFRSRMRFTKSLVEHCALIPPLCLDEDSLILRTPKGKRKKGDTIPFDDTPDTVRMRESVLRINRQIRNVHEII